MLFSPYALDLAPYGHKVQPVLSVNWVVCRGSGAADGGCCSRALRPAMPERENKRLASLAPLRGRSVRPSTMQRFMITSPMTCWSMIVSACVHRRRSEMPGKARQSCNFPTHDVCLFYIQIVSQQHPMLPRPSRQRTGQTCVVDAQPANATGSAGGRFGGGSNLLFLRHHGCISVLLLAYSRLSLARNRAACFISMRCYL